jgi:MFS family permease
MFYKFCLYGFLKNLKFFETFLMLFFLEKGLSFLQIGALYSIQFIAVNILQMPTGVFADAMGRRRTMILSFGSYIVSFVMFFFSTSYVMFAVSMCFFAFGESFRSGTHKAMIFQYLKIQGWQDQKVHYYGHTRSWSQAGSALSVLIAACIVFYSGSYKYIFLASIIPYLLDMLLVFSYPAQLDSQVKHLDAARLRGSFLSVVKESLSAFKDRHVVSSILNAAVYTGFYDAMKTYLQPVVKTLALSLPVMLAYNEKERSAVVIGLVYAVLYLLTAYFSRVSGRVSEMFRTLSLPLNLFLLAGLGFGVLSGILYHYGFLLAAVIVYIGIYIIQNVRRPISEAYITDMVDHSILATALSAEGQVSTLLTAVLAPVLGVLADHYGVGMALVVLSAGMVLFFPLCYARQRKEPAAG